MINNRKIFEENAKLTATVYDKSWYVIRSFEDFYFKICTEIACFSC